MSHYDINSIPTPKCHPSSPKSLKRPSEERPRNKGDYPHYFKDVSNLNVIDVYHFCKLFEVDDNSGCLHHAIKKIVCGGKRGVKDKNQDIKEAVASLNRYLEIYRND